ncbi:hypothetical protein [Neokomagataea anthophila]|uniref:Uncharacterized protein n=1 Tax=Neokomagataea anthophila TaxID=2826925 RepID=A0ABS5EAH9_9PROT|nr:hypothetical protein [Neokomagataea anthophila]MBR0560498.1 hypothetical protein [Neokomagataea anthophila]
MIKKENRDPDTDASSVETPIASFDNTGRFVITDPEILMAISGGKAATAQKNTQVEALDAVDSNDIAPSDTGIPDLLQCADYSCVTPVDTACTTPA